MLEKILRGRLPEQIVALIENLEQNPDTSHLDKIDRFLAHDEIEITKFEYWMLRRVRRKVADIARRDATLQRAMEIVINKPETYDANTYKYKASGRYALDTALGTNAMTAQALQESAEKIQRAQMAQQMMNNTWTDPRIALQQRLHDNY